MKRAGTWNLFPLHYIWKIQLSILHFAKKIPGNAWMYQKFKGILWIIMMIIELNPQKKKKIGLIFSLHIWKTLACSKIVFKMNLKNSSFETKNQKQYYNLRNKLIESLRTLC